MPILNDLEDLKNYPFSSLDLPSKVLMVTPEHFNVDYSINPHMESVEGELPKIDEKRALFQWEKLKEKVSEFGLKVYSLNGKEDLPDMVFSANQTLPLDSKTVLMSKMAFEERRGEVPFFSDFFENRGYQVKKLPEEVNMLEGTGDALWHYGMDLLWCGHGFRTDQSAINYLGNELNLAVAPLKLVDEYFYHLDTCMCLLDSKTVAWVPKAFSNESAELIDNFFPKTIEIPIDEAREFFSCNSWSVDGKNILVPYGAEIMKKKLEDHGYIVHELDTSEFIKAGGSIFCLKLAFF